MTSERIKEIQLETAYPNSVSVQQALLKVWNECEQAKQRREKTAELVKKCQERMKSIRDKNYFTLRFGKTKMYSEKPFKKINMKQTAVEWLVEHFDLEMQDDFYLDKINQAKEMEKEQMNNFFKNGIEYGFDSYHANELAEEPTRPNFEQYYNETFKSE
jgi:hypothetical protein